MKTFAAIDVGSYELCMKIFELSGKNRMREVDHIRYRIDLGSETYATGKLSYEKVDELCKVLSEFVTIMDSYKVDAYKAYGTSAVREMENVSIILDQIMQRTGIKIDVLSNSEQRFLDYKSIASTGQEFDLMIQEGTAIVDIGGGSIQVSLFDKGTLYTTQNIKLGILRLRERLNRINAKPSQIAELIEEMAAAQLSVLNKLYLKDKVIKNIILVDDYLAPWIHSNKAEKEQAGYIDQTVYNHFINTVKNKSRNEIARMLNISDDNANLMYLSAILVKQIRDMMGADRIWAPGVTLCDGIAYEYAENQKMFTGSHNFEKDILDCAINISKRYMGSRKRADTLEQITMTVFDSMKKLHGLGKRERLYLQIASILHDCGKYISLVNLGECSYHIIMSTEIIGLSHMEREIVAYIVKFNHDDFVYYNDLHKDCSLDRNAYLIVAKLTAILRIANGLDRSHKQKFKNVKATVKDGELIITVDTGEDITLEKGLFGNRAAFFEEVYCVKPVIKQKRSL